MHTVSVVYSHVHVLCVRTENGRDKRTRILTKLILEHDCVAPLKLAKAIWPTARGIVLPSAGAGSQMMQTRVFLPHSRHILEHGAAVVAARLEQVAAIDQRRQPRLEQRGADLDRSAVPLQWVGGRAGAIRRTQTQTTTGAGTGTGVRTDIGA